MLIHIFVVSSERQTCNVKQRVMTAQGQFKVVDFGTNRKRLCGFLLVFNSNLGRILHRFGDTAIYRSKNRKKNRPFEPTPVSQSQIALDRDDPLRIFRRVIPCQNLKSWDIRWWRNHDASSFRFDTIPDGTDGQTARHVALTKDPIYAWSVARVGLIIIDDA